MGELHLTRADGTFLVAQADPRIAITDKMLHYIYWQSPDLPGATLKRAPEGHGSTGHSPTDYPDCDTLPGQICFRNAILTIRADNRTVIYRIDRYRPKDDCWEASWPD